MRSSNISRISLEEKQEDELLYLVHQLQLQDDENEEVQDTKDGGGEEVDAEEAEEEEEEEPQQGEIETIERTKKLSISVKKQLIRKLVRTDRRNLNDIKFQKYLEKQHKKKLKTEKYLSSLNNSKEDNFLFPDNGSNNNSNSSESYIHNSNNADNFDDSTQQQHQKYQEDQQEQKFQQIDNNNNNNNEIDTFFEEVESISYETTEVLSLSSSSTTTTTKLADLENNNRISRENVEESKQIIISKTTLPIHNETVKRDLLSALKQFPVVILVGETGCGLVIITHY